MVCRGVKGMYRDGNYNNGEIVDYFYNTGSPPTRVSTTCFTSTITIYIIQHWTTANKKTKNKKKIYKGKRIGQWTVDIGALVNWTIIEGS